MGVLAFPVPKLHSNLLTVMFTLRRISTTGTLHTSVFTSRTMSTLPPWENSTDYQALRVSSHKTHASFLYLLCTSSLTVNGSTNPSSSTLISTSGERRKETFSVWHPHKHYVPVLLLLLLFWIPPHCHVPAVLKAAKQWPHQTTVRIWL